MGVFQSSQLFCMPLFPWEWNFWQRCLEIEMFNKIANCVCLIHELIWWFDLSNCFKFRLLCSVDQHCRWLSYHPTLSTIHSHLFSVVMYVTYFTFHSLLFSPQRKSEECPIIWNPTTFILKVTAKDTIVRFELILQGAKSLEVLLYVYFNTRLAGVWYTFTCVS